MDNVRPVMFQQFDEPERKIPSREQMNLISSVPLLVTVELGRTKKTIDEILRLAPGTIVELDKLAGDTVDILVNGKVIAKGEVVILDEKFGVRIVSMMNK